MKSRHDKPTLNTTAAPMQMRAASAGCIFDHHFPTLHFLDFMVLLLQKLWMDFVALCLILKMKVRTIICCRSFTKSCL